jgi:GH15 family glucan-1,4-alpha-glucosidase
MLPSSIPTLDLAVVGNCSTAALVDPAGQIVWWCYPRFDSGPVFSALLDPQVQASRAFAVELEGLASTTQWYEPRTAVLRTRLLDQAGQGVEITDFAPRFNLHGRLFRPAQLVRRIRPIGGRPRVRVWFRPGGAWSRSEPAVSRGSHHLRFAWTGLAFRLNTNLPLTAYFAPSWTAVSPDRGRRFRRT